MDAKLSRSTKFVYGFGDLGNSIAYTIIGFFYLFYLTDIARIRPGIAGSILLIGKIWDAVVDPFIGHKSDNLKSPMGKRRPFFLYFSVPFALFFFLLWNVPESTNIVKIAYISISFIAFITFFSLIQIPYSSLTAQLTEDYNERTGLTAYRMAFSIIGGLICAVIPIEIVHAFSNQRTGFSIMGLIFAVVIFLSPLLMFIFIKEKRAREKSEKFSFVKGLLVVFKNKPFISAILMFLFTWMAVDVLSAMMIYYIKYWLNMETQTSVILGLVFVTAVIFLPFWYKISEKIGKKKTYTISSLLMVAVFIALYFLPRDDRFYVYVLSFFGGIGISAAHIIPWSILPDVVEYDELKTGKRREGIYSGFSSFLHQLSASGALFLIGILLEIFGYVPNVEQTSKSLLAIKLLLGPLPALLFLLGILSIIFYPITESFHRRIEVILSNKRLRYDR